MQRSDAILGINEKANFADAVMAVMQNFAVQLYLVKMKHFLP